LVLVGAGDLRDQLEEQIKNLRLAGQVHFLGLRTDIPEVLGAMDVFVLSSDYEGNPLSVMEAMAAGLPIVSTAAGGVPDLFEYGKEGFLVQPGDFQGLSDSMAALLRNEKPGSRWGWAAARRARKNYDVSTMVPGLRGSVRESGRSGARCESGKRASPARCAAATNLKGNMIKVMHVITTLGPAGAETMLFRVATGMDGTRF